MDTGDWMPDIAVPCHPCGVPMPCAAGSSIRENWWVIRKTGLWFVDYPAPLAVVAGWLLAVEVFEVPFRLDLVRMALVWLGITSITVVVGLAGSRGVLRRPPLAVFRDLAG